MQGMDDWQKSRAMRGQLEIKDAEIARLTAEIERLIAECAAAWDKCEERRLAQEKAEAERDEARAQVAAAYEAAANLPAVCYDNVVDRNAIRALTPADAISTLAARDAAKVAEGREQGLREAAEICARQAVVFRSDEYATNQPFSSSAERFACSLVKEAILYETKKLK